MNDDTATRDEVAANRDHAALNLLRMRGELEQARQFGSAVLKKHPNDPALYELMGEIHLDLGEEDQALNWFDMALDLDPSLATVRAKVDEVRSRNATKDQNEAVERLGMPSKSRFPWLVLSLTSLAVLGLVLGAFAIGRNLGKEKDTIVAPPVALNSPKADVSPEPQIQEPKESPTEPSPSAATVALDQALMSRIGSASGSGVTFLSAVYDPRGPSCLVTVEAIEGEPNPATALRAALAVNQADPQFATIQVRVVDNGSVVYAATVVKDTLSTVASAIAGGDTLEKQAEVALGNVWPTNGTPPATSEDGSQAGL